jgi:transposase
MVSFRIKMSSEQKKRVRNALTQSQNKGDLSEVKRFLLLIALSEGHLIPDIASILKMSTQTVRQVFYRYLSEGIKGLYSKRSPGRPSKLTKKQRKQLSEWIKSGPEKMGFVGACWRTPMIQHLIQEKFGIYYNAHYLSELLKNLGFSYQKATFVAVKRDEEKRKKWLKETWPTIRQLAEEKNAYILFGDEASFPQWGTLSYTWSVRGEQPIIPTSGARKAYKVFGLIDYFTGRFFSKGHIGKLNSASYIVFLEDVLSKTRKHIILIQDGAPYHRSSEVKKFFNEHKDRLTVFQLPSYSPDFNPIEKLWKQIKVTGTHLKYFPTFEALTETVDNMLFHFENIGRTVLNIFGFYQEMECAI